MTSATRQVTIDATDDTTLLRVDGLVWLRLDPRTIDTLADALRDGAREAMNVDRRISLDHGQIWTLPATLPEPAVYADRDGVLVVAGGDELRLDPVAAQRLARDLDH